MIEAGQDDDADREVVRRFDRAAHLLTLEILRNDQHLTRARCAHRFADLIRPPLRDGSPRKAARRYRDETESGIRNGHLEDALRFTPADDNRRRRPTTAFASSG